MKMQLKAHTRIYTNNKSLSIILQLLEYVLFGKLKPK